MAITNKPLRYASYKIENGKMKKKYSGGLDCTVFDVSPSVGGKIVANISLTENDTQPSPQPAKISVLNYENGKITFDRISVVQRNPEYFNNSRLSYFGNISDLPRYYEFMNGLNIDQQWTNGQSRILRKGFIYYYDRENQTMVFCNPETFIKYQRDFLADPGGVPA
jgi:hypothetical protein